MDIKPEREPVSLARATKEALVQRPPWAGRMASLSLFLRPALRWIAMSSDCKHFIFIAQEEQISPRF